MVGRSVCRVIPGLALVALSFAAACQPGGGLSDAVTCYPSGQCFDSSGNQVEPDPSNPNNYIPVTINGGTGTGTTTGPVTGNPNTGVDPNNPNTNQPIMVLGCSCTANPGTDNDGDCINNSVELAHNNSDPNKKDTDGDGIIDGCEDVNHDGLYDIGIDTDPLNPDTDCDGLWDGNSAKVGLPLPTRAQVRTALGARAALSSNNAQSPSCAPYVSSPSTYTFADGTAGVEDKNNNGIVESGETSPNLLDSDRDQIPDGLEDANLNGVVDGWVDVNTNGCFDPGTDTPGESNPSKLDTDGDGVSDGLEDKNHSGQYDPSAVGLLTETIAWLVDTDCDKLSDGVEDNNHNGILDGGETSPRLQDSDGDNLCDGKEDVNHNGRWDQGLETSPILTDTDADGIPDGIEAHDPNLVNCAGPAGNFNPSNPTVCWDGNPATAGSSDPRKLDTDGDGIADGLEDTNQDGICQTATLPNPTNPSTTMLTFVETCAFSKDTDCDGLTDNLEDKNHNGVVDQGETDPRKIDTDFDTLTDGCPKTGATAGCEDKNNNGVVDPNETDPKNPDSDGDQLSDSCELNFAADSAYGAKGATNPLNIDTDGDGVADGDEDADHSCSTNGSETDPRHYDAAPAQGTAGYPQFNVCAADSLNNVNFAQDARSYADLRVAFEEERVATGASCTQNNDTQCPLGQTCLGTACVLEAPYIIQPFGADNDANGFDENDQNDTLWGYTFESPPGVTPDSVTGVAIDRDIYGFIQISEDTRALDDILDSIRSTFTTRYASATVTQTGSLPARAAFDSTPTAPVNFAQRQFSFNFTSTQGSLNFRNDVLLNQFFKGSTLAPSTVPPTQDPVHGNVVCPSGGATKCFANFTLYITQVQRPKQKGPTGKPVIITVVALTPNDSNPAQPTLAANRHYPDRVTRLQDLTGGSQVAHYGENTGKSCDELGEAQAQADVLWVVDDSRSMQQIISRLEQAATAVKTILTANSGIINYRIGMTTTNPAGTGATQCPSYCDAQCNGTTATFTPPGVTGSNPGSYWCDNLCADQALGCIKKCAPTCTEGTVNNANGYTRTCGSNCANNDVCGLCNGHDISATCSAQNASVAGNPNFACVDNSNPNSMVSAINADGSLFNRSMPGGGGTFYYEDTAFMDCDSFDSGGQAQFVNECGNSTYATGTIGAFFTDTQTYGRKQLTGNAGMIGADVNAVLGTVPSCVTTMLDLNAITSGNGNPCTDGVSCCGRLTDVCDDGPTVFASQMCDLIRGMGGLPALTSLPGAPAVYSSGARRHSAPEQGSRSARRLLQSMIPALPVDYSGALNKAQHLRLTCKTGAPLAGGGTCQVCDPTTDTTCKPVPVAVVMLSDEEDFFFKDDCQVNQGTDPNYPNPGSTPGGGADKAELPLNCLYVDGDPNTVDACSTNYCAAFAATDGIPTGYFPDQAAWTTDGFYTERWRNPNAPECSSAKNALGTSCVADPCPQQPNATACNALSQCVFNTTTNTCYSHCAAYVLNPPSSASDANNQRIACETDPVCRWDQSQVSDFFNVAPYTNACVSKFPLNDCQACKRFRRLNDAVNGTTQHVGFGEVGPVYAITRNKGAPGQGSWVKNGTGQDAQDLCKGGDITWGRGDGQAYRDIATATLGRIQDVCASDYSSFVQLLVADLAVLSKPYPLTASPIASTLKVGISRPDPDNAGSYLYIPVPRSQTSGFFYDATGNTIGFKSDPVDGQCGGSGSAFSCSLNGVIETDEIIYAETAPFVPQPNDQIYVSYRLWEPVPCGGACPAGETCAEVVCTAQAQTSCPAGDPNANAFCAPGYLCNGSGACTQNCTTGQLIEACVNQPECGACQDFNSTTRKCEAIPNTCSCNPGVGRACNPHSVNNCPIGYSCDESCVCASNSGCSVGFNNDGTLSCGSTGQAACGQAAVACCNTFAQTANTTTQACASYTSENTCQANSSCVWRGTSTAGECGSIVQACCQPGSTPGYYIDPETGIVSVVCIPATCECCCGTGLECDPSAPVLGPTNTCLDGNPACACYNNGG